MLFGRLLGVVMVGAELEYDGDALSSEQMGAVHGKVDANKDGKLHLEEMLAYSETMRSEIAKKDVLTLLDDFDHSKDGKASLDEILNYTGEWADFDKDDEKESEAHRALEEAKFRAADGDGDGLLDINELPAFFYPETKNEVLEITARASLEAHDTDKDGVLTSKEFWAGDAIDGEEIPISEAQQADFARLDKDNSSTISLEEMKYWESGRFHTDQAMEKIFEHADADSDLHITAQEFDAAKVEIADSDAQYHIRGWVEHHEL